jgi:hypothetical protein
MYTFHSLMSIIIHNAKSDVKVRLMRSTSDRSLWHASMSNPRSFPVDSGGIGYPPTLIFELPGSHMSGGTMKPDLVSSKAGSLLRVHDQFQLCASRLPLPPTSSLCAMVLKELDELAFVGWA